MIYSVVAILMLNCAIIRYVANAKTGAVAEHMVQIQHPFLCVVIGCISRIADARLDARMPHRRTGLYL